MWSPACYRRWRLSSDRDWIRSEHGWQFICWCVAWLWFQFSNFKLGRAIALSYECWIWDFLFGSMGMSSRMTFTSYCCLAFVRMSQSNFQTPPCFNRSIRKLRNQKSKAKVITDGQKVRIIIYFLFEDSQEKLAYTHRNWHTRGFPFFIRHNSQHLFYVRVRVEWEPSTK